MLTPFDYCLQHLTKEASAVTRAKGVKRLGQLLSGSRYRALEDRASGLRAAAKRNMASGRDAHAARGQAATAGAERAASAAKDESRSIGKAWAGTLGATAVGSTAANEALDARARKKDWSKQAAAEEDKKPKGKFPFKQVAKIVGGGLAGYGSGMVAGQLAGKAIGKVVGPKSAGDVARKIAPVAGSAIGVAYPMWKAREMKELSDAVENSRNRSK